MSQEIEAYERNMAQKADCLLVPANVRDRMVKELDADETKVFGFPMQGRLPDEWECPLDFGQVKKDIGFGPLDRLLLFVGPLEHATGVDLLLEALPILLGRADNIRFALVGEGDMHSHLEHHMHHLGVSHAIRLLGHVEGDFLTKLVRSAEALVLPSRFRVPMDDAVVDLARRGGRPVITTHGGPAHLIHHEETGIITYDNPGSIVWAVDRIISDPFHADQMGRNGKRSENSMPNWEEVGRRYLEICATNFPSLRRDSSDKQGTPSEGKVSAETIPDRDAVPARPEHPQAEQSPPHYGKAPFQGYQAPPAEEREITPSNVPTVQEEPTEQENPERVDEFAEPQDFSENNETPTAEQPLPQVESVAVETQPSPDESFQQESPQEDDSQGLPPLYHEVSPQVDEATSKISDMHKEWEEQGTSQQPEKVELPPAIVETTKEQLVVAAFCFESPDSPVGQYVANELAGLTRRGVEVHLFSRRPFVVEEPNLKNYAVSCDEKAEYLDQVEEFTSHASNRFMQRFPTGLGNLILLGHEWSTIPALSMLHGLKNLTTVLSLHSLERQRSDLSSDTSRKIDEIERTGLREARSIVIHNEATRKVVSEWSHEWDGKLVNAYPRFPTETFASDLDAGEVKARYEIGPVDPLILYNGDFSQRYGPDLLVKAMPAILKNHPQARLVLLGYGEEYWPLRVYVRYLLLEHAIRIPGSIEGPELQELIRAADIIAVPSREPTPWWPIQAAWAAQRPILATHDAAPDLLEHEKDSVLCYSSVNSCVWGIERLLFDEKLRATLGKNGNRKLKARFGWDQVAEHLEEHLRSAIRK